MGGDTISAFESTEIQILRDLTFVVAVFVTKQVPPFSHGFVRQKTNCERLPVATDQLSAKLFPPRGLLLFDELPRLAMTANVSASNCLYSTCGFSSVDLPLGVIAIVRLY